MKIEYRDYVISACEYGGFEFYKEFYDGEPIDHAPTIALAKRDIDNIIFENQEWPVQLGNSRVETFAFLDTALSYLNGHGWRSGAVPLFSFDSI